MLTSPPDGWSIPSLLAPLGLDPSRLSADAERHLRAWLDLLVTWNARIDLTAARSNEELLDLMVVDSLMLASEIPQGVSVIDIGSGAGAPGLALAILRPDLRMTLVEPLTKRVSFLRTVLGTIDRVDVRLERAKSDEVIRSRRTFDVAIARATLPPPEWLKAGLSLTPTGGAVFALLAKEEPPQDPRARLEADLNYSWPNTGVLRRLVRFRKDSE